MKRKIIQNILLIRPTTTLPIDQKNQGVGPLLGILYIATLLLKKGYTVTVLDASNSDRQQRRGNFITYGSDDDTIEAGIQKVSPDIVGITCFTTASEFDLFRMCRIVKKINTDIPIVVGGFHPSICPERMLRRSYIDYVIMYEGEYRFLSLLESLNKNESEFIFDGIAYKKDGKIKINYPISWIEDLDSLPYPDLGLVDYEGYVSINKKYAWVQPPYRKAQILATRGCFNRCRYCFEYKFWGNKIRTRSVKNIIEEIRFQKKQFQIEEILFVDDNLTFNKRFMKQLVSELKKLGIPWEAPLGIYPHMLDNEIIKLMANSGISEVKLAIESGSKRVLKNIMRRHLDLDLIKPIVNQLHKYNIKAFGSFMLGMIGETRKEIFQTINFPNKVGLDGSSFQVAFPLLGTEFYEEARKKDYLIKPYDFRNVFINRELPSIRIPESSPDFAMHTEELYDLIREKLNNLSKIIKPY